MKHALVSITAGLAGIVLSFSLFMTFRADMVERTTAASIDKSARTNRQILMTLNSRAHDGAALSRRLEEIARKTKSLAVLAAMDRTGAVLWASKNQNYIPAAALYDSVMNDFTAGKISNQGAPRYYPTEGTQGKGDLKLYCYTLRDNETGYLMAYAYDPERPVIIRFIMEIILLAILNISGALLIYLVLRGRTSLYHEKKGKTSPIRPEDTNRLMDDGIRHFFGTLAQSVDPDKACIYLINNNGKTFMEYRYLRGGPLTSQSGGDLSHGLAETVTAELRGSAALVSEGGKKVYSPVMAGDSVAALAAVEKAQGITGNDINGIVEGLKRAAPGIRDFISSRSLLMDGETGLYSKNFCETKLEECRYRFDEFREDSTLMLLELEVDYAVEDMSSFIKAAAPIVRQWLPPGHHLCRYGNKIAAILPGMSGLRAKGLSDKVMKTLSETRIRVDESMLLPLRPRIGIASASNAGNGSFINLALADMDEPLR